MLVGFGVITNRINRDHEGAVPSYADLSGPDRIQVATALFKDYSDHNALRFGVSSAGVQKTTFKTRENDEGELEKYPVTVDKDKARTKRQVEQNMEAVGYSDGVTAHSALKLSTEELMKIRREYPELDMDKFYRDANFYRNLREQLDNREQ